MASVTEQEVPGRGDHRGDGQKEQDDAVEEHRGKPWLVLAGKVWRDCRTPLNDVAEVQKKMSHKANSSESPGARFRKKGKRKKTLIVLLHVGGGR